MQLRFAKSTSKSPPPFFLYVLNVDAKISQRKLTLISSPSASNCQKIGVLPHNSRWRGGAAKMTWGSFLMNFIMISLQHILLDFHQQASQCPSATSLKALQNICLSVYIYIGGVNFPEPDSLLVTWIIDMFKVMQGCDSPTKVIPSLKKSVDSRN